MLEQATPAERHNLNLDLSLMLIKTRIITKIMLEVEVEIKVIVFQLLGKTSDNLIQKLIGIHLLLDQI